MLQKFRLIHSRGLLTWLTELTDPCLDLCLDPANTVCGSISVYLCKLLLVATTLTLDLLKNYALTFDYDKGFDYS